MASRKKPRRTKTTRARGRRRARSVAKSGPGGASGAASATEQALQALTEFLNRSKVPYSIIGGIAVIAWGFGRSTLDIDAAVALVPSDAGKLISAFGKVGFTPRIPDCRAFAEENLVLLLRHEPTGVDIDVSLAQLDFEREALEHAVQRSFGSVVIRVPRPSDLVVYKLIAGRPRDLQDVEELMARGLAVDEERVRHLLREFDALLDLNREGDWLRLADRLKGQM